jgi:4-hydroxy-3-methylbut-2-enyl diphosphate reductase IspH
MEAVWCPLVAAQHLAAVRHDKASDEVTVLGKSHHMEGIKLHISSYPKFSANKFIVFKVNLSRKWNRIPIMNKCKWNLHEA